MFRMSQFVRMVLVVTSLTMLGLMNFGCRSQPNSGTMWYPEFDREAEKKEAKQVYFDPALYDVYELFPKLASGIPSELIRPDIPLRIVAKVNDPADRSGRPSDPHGCAARTSAAMLRDWERAKGASIGTYLIVIYVRSTSERNLGAVINKHGYISVSAGETLGYRGLPQSLLASPTGPVFRVVPDGITQDPDKDIPQILRNCYAAIHNYETIDSDAIQLRRVVGSGLAVIVIVILAVRFRREAWAFLVGVWEFVKDFLAAIWEIVRDLFPLRPRE